MSTMRDALERYLALRRGLGWELHRSGARLHRFVDFLEREGATVITTDLALRWATATADAAPGSWGQRLGDVRRFATWLSAEDPRGEVPPRGLLSERYRRPPPYIFSDGEVCAIIRKAARLSSPLGLRGHTYATLFGLLAATGLRLGEALALDRDDVNLHAGLLFIRRGKGGKSRFVPVHDSTRHALKRYAKRRGVILQRPASQAFFLSERGTRVAQSSAGYNFAVTSCAVGLRPPMRGRRYGHGPRLHDMRHRFAARTLVRWYREGRDVERELPKLSTYLGHAHIADTYWYLEAVPELLQLATERAAGAPGEAP